MRVLIAGCGYVGSALGVRLAAAGHEVFGLRRTASPLPEGIVPVVADVGDAVSLTALPQALDAVVYAVSADAHDDAGYVSAYVAGPARLLEALRGQAVRRFVFVSSTGVYHQQGGEWVDEDSPCAPTAFSGQRLLQGEQVVFAGAFPATIVRLGGIYGPGRTRLVESVRRGTARLPAGAPRFTNRVHRDDAAGILDHVLGMENPASLYVGVDREPAPEDEVLRWIAGKLGVPEPPEGTPGELPGRGGNKRCSSARLVAAGYRFLYPTYREGYGCSII